ncbi:MAG: hypothetical protein OHK0022_19290 [Roseiflexaceae bacterium]
MPSTSHISESLVDELLTFIEQREAEQIAYGIYDVTMTGADLLHDFQPRDKRTGEETLTALALLSKRLDILRFDNYGDEQPEAWVFRSRIAEMVRIIALLRLRSAFHQGMRQTHRISSGKRLVADVTLTVMSRLVPRRDQPSRTVIKKALSSASERQHAADLLVEVIEQALPKLRHMSGFQRRALESILQTVELDEQRAGERGTVITASTGAGKTYAFFLPTLIKAILERSLRQKVGVKAICIYPRVALSENQLSDFVEILFHVNQALEFAGLQPITIGVESGSTVYDLREFKIRTAQQRQKLANRRGWVYQDQTGFLAPFAYCIGTAHHACADQPQRLALRPEVDTVLHCPHCGKRYPFILFIRHEVMDHRPPDILVTTTESLNKRLTGAHYQYLFGTQQFCAPSVVMLDEIHLQTSTAGTQTALLLRRLLARVRDGRAERGELGNIAFVGLSATIAQPVQFVAELTGMLPERIAEVRPQEHELEVVGAERFIFVRASESEDTATISTLIQTTMAVLHTMPQPGPGGALERYRSFGFVQSLDVVGRWLYQIEDAERGRVNQREKLERYRQSNQPPSSWPIQDVPLFMYRQPPHNRELFPRLLGNAPVPNCGCEHRNGPDTGCPIYQAGECWWVLSRPEQARATPLVVKRKSASDRATAIEAGDDLIVTTSALEVGYDDDALMCVIQYGAPANIASFVQRKGRGGRKVGTRPIVVTVLSPYSAAEIFLYRNQHLLTDPIFRKLPLNVQNRFLQRIHGFYAVADRLAQIAHRAKVDLEIEKLTPNGLELLKRNLVDDVVLIQLKDHIARAFSLDSRTATALMSDNDGILLEMFLELVKRATNSPDLTSQYGVDARKLLRDRLPENLFSDINLPEAHVFYRPNQEVGPAENIGFALATTVPGNVTFRGGVGSVWVPPIITSDQGEIPRHVISEFYKGSLLSQEAKTAQLPERALKLAGIDSRQTRELPIYRPDEIRPKPFSHDHNSAFWYCDPRTGKLNYRSHYTEANQNETQLAHSSKAFPISAVEIIPPLDSEEMPPAFRLTRTHTTLRADLLGERLARQIVLYSDDPANRNLLDVRLMVLGSQYALTFHQQRHEPIEGLVGFVVDTSSNTPCALGYRMETEGLALDLAMDELARTPLPPVLAAALRYAAVRHAFVTVMTVEHSQNIFAAAHLADTLLLLADLRCAEGGATPISLSTWMVPGNPDFQRELNWAIDKVFLLSPKKSRATLDLATSHEYLRVFAQIYAEIAANGRSAQNHLHDTFKYSIAQALKQAAQEIAGVEALRYLGAWTKLRVDYGARAPNRIWLYEIGMGGVGVMRATHKVLLDEPDRFWAALGQHMTRCPTAQEEALLRHILAQPEAWLQHCDDLAQTLRSAASSIERQTSIEALLTEVRGRLGVIARQEQAKALLRIFIPEYVEQLDGQPLVNWQLYREINHQFLPSCTSRLGRQPTFNEARGLLYLAVSRDAAAYPELARLLAVYRREYGADDEQGVREAFESAVDRRLLITCAGACPSCLNDRGGQESPSTGWMLLSRPLLRTWLDHVRAGHLVQMDHQIRGVDVQERLGELFQSGARVAYLRVPGSALAALCATISYLTDAGIDTELGMVYPMITDVQTVFPETIGEPPLVEVTIRPIL